MKKVLKVIRIGIITFALLIVVFFIAVILINIFRSEERTTGVYQEKGGDVLYITNQYGDDSEFTVLKNDNILELKGTACWKSINEGKCVFVEDWYDYPYYYRCSTVYEISVDENLKISFEEREVWKLDRCDMVHDYGDKIDVEKNDYISSLHWEKQIELIDEFETVYFDYAECDAPDLTDATKIIAYSDNDEVEWEMFVTQDRIYEYSKDENETITEWYEGIPIECCNLDKINELLNN